MTRLATAGEGVRGERLSDRAFDRLIQLQHLHPIHRRGDQVAPITLADVRQTVELRLIVEPPVGRIAGANPIDRG